MNFDTETRRVLCSFLNETLINISRQCIATISYGANCDLGVTVYQNTSNSVSVLTPPIEFMDEVSEYCLCVKAISNTVSLSVEGALVDIGGCFIGYMAIL